MFENCGVSNQYAFSFIRLKSNDRTHSNFRIISLLNGNKKPMQHTLYSFMTS